jgi:CDP-diglyceride synthetase
LQTFPWAVLIVLAILLIRWAALKVIKLPTTPLLFIAPRGLITILLFITILPSESIDVANKSLIIQTIIISALVMMVGLMTVKNDKALQMSAKNENVLGEIPKNTKKDQP